MAVQTRPRINRISIKDIWHQLKADLIGKDSYRGVTLTYSWLANQFGHFSLGFIPTLILYSCLKKCDSINNPSFWSALIVSLIWLSFELYNFLGPLLLKSIPNSKVLFHPTDPKYEFQPHWVNVAFDTFTDLCFFWVGAFAASIFIIYSWGIGLVIVILIVILIYPIYYWFLTKMYTQFADYPFQFRLSQWNLKIGPKEKEIVKGFIKHSELGKHLLIFGSKKSGKTSISVGIATELSIKHYPCIYTTAMKLYSLFHENNNLRDLDKSETWTWRTSAILVIDDINPGEPIKNELITPNRFLSLIDRESNGPNCQNRADLKRLSIIWVMGNQDPEESLINNWIDMLKNIGIDEGNILNINLG